MAGPYFLITFTLPAQLRPLAWAHQRIVYAALMDCAWQTLREFAHNHRQLRGCPGAVAVLHTHSRALELHPHVHLAMPGAALDERQRLWRQLQRDQGYLFNHKALAKVFCGKLLDALKAQGLAPPLVLPERWVVDCKRLDHGGAAVVYLGRYLYRGVIQERDIVRCAQAQVTFRYRDSASGKNTTRTVSGTHFLWLVLQHVLPKGFRRSRNFGLLHPNCRHRQRLALLRMRLRPVTVGATASCPPGMPPFTQAPTQPALSERPKLKCRCCGAAMVIVRRRIAPLASTDGAPAPGDAVRAGSMG